MVTINDLPVSGLFKVYDIRSRSVIFFSAGGDVPPDVAMLPVIRFHSCNDVIYIDVEVL